MGKMPYRAGTGGWKVEEQIYSKCVAPRDRTQETHAPLVTTHDPLESLQLADVTLAFVL